MDQMLAIFPAPEDYEIVFATFKKPDALSKIDGFPSYWLHWPTNRNVKNTLANTLLAIRIIRRERPDVIVSTGAAAAVPFFLVGKLLRGTKNIFIECIDRIAMPTLTARLVKPVTDRYICQWETQLSGFPHRVNIGRSR